MKTRLLIIGIVIVTVGLVSIQSHNDQLFGNSNAKTELPQQDSGLMIPPGEKISQIPYVKQIGSLSEIKNLKGYEVKLEKNLPEGYSVQYIASSISEDDDFVNIFVSKEPVTDETTDMGFLFGGDGAIVTITKFDPTVHTQEYLYDRVAFFDPIPVKIFGQEGYGNDITIRETIEGYPTTSPAQLVFNHGDKHIVLIGMVPLDTLIEIAKSF